MHNSVDKLNLIKKEILAKSFNDVNIIAVSKTFPMSEILPVINSGHNHFGENKIQEAMEKWSDIKNDFPLIQLHMIGKLQTNKVKYAISIFDYIHSLDSLKLAEKICKEEIKQKKKLKIFIQVNIGQESQKSGIQIAELSNFYEVCSKKLGLNIIGLMCLPPDNQDVTKYFSKISELKNELNLKDLSIGMSNDYLNALSYNSTFVRIGSKIFGKRS
tara:strand:- start:6 stop:653 length:648 start_codon:yes stop_codon:yes gene_type:complete